LLNESFLKNIENGDLVSLVGHSPLVPFNLFWIKKNGKKVLLKSTGEFSSRGELEKWLNKNLNLQSESTLNESWIQEGIQRLNTFNKLLSEDHGDPIALQNWQVEWINWLSPYFWEADKGVSRLDVCFLMGIFFCDLTDNEEELFLNFPIELQKKNYLMASYGALLATLLGYNERKFLRDYFKVLLFWDAPFTETIWSESEKNFLKQEWSEPGLGYALSSETQGKVARLFQESVPRIKALLAESLDFKGLLKYLDWSFESLSGEGHPYGFKAQELSDLDVLSIFISHRFSYEEHLSTDLEKEGVRKLFDTSGDFKKNNLSARLEIIVKTAFSRALELKGGYLEIVGL
jgi:hypothetical protein